VSAATSVKWYKLYSSKENPTPSADGAHTLLHLCLSEYRNAMEGRVAAQVTKVKDKV